MRRRRADQAAAFAGEIILIAGSGYRMEIYGREGTLVATGEDSPQLNEVFLHGAKGGNTLAPMPVPERLTFAAPVRRQVKP